METKTKILDLLSFSVAKLPERKHDLPRASKLKRSDPDGHSRLTEER